MAMTRKLVREDALQQATRLFWRHGYNGTSMDMLTKALGVEKPSIYAAFGNKRSLFLATLLHYRTHLVEQVRAYLASAPTPRTGLDAVVRFMMTSLHEPDMQDGCLVSNAALEVADHDPDVAEHVRRMLQEMGALFEEALRAGQAAGEVTSRVAPDLLAKYLVNSIEGTRIVEKTHPAREELVALGDFVLKALDP